MPEHTTFMTMILAYVKDTLRHNAEGLGASLLEHREPSWQSFEPIAAALFVVLVLLGLSASTRSKLKNSDAAIVPDDRLTIRTFMEAFLGYFYDQAKGIMGAERAKKYFPLIGTSALFVFFSNVLALVPGWPIATSNLNITMGCALVVFILFNAYGLKEQGLSYFKHLAGPVWWLSWLILPIELISVCVRPITLAVRLMLNMAVDHLVLGILVGLIGIVVPVPMMLLGCLIILIQTLVFALLTTIYIALATEEEEH